MKQPVDLQIPMNKHIARICFLIAFAAPSFAWQGINVTFQDATQTSAPSPSYAGGANQPGTWNRVQFGSAGSFFSGTLVDIQGNQTGVSLNVQLHNGIFPFPCSYAPGDIGLLMETGVWFSGDDQTQKVRISGLFPGIYTLYTYADEGLTGGDVHTQGVSRNVRTSFCTNQLQEGRDFSVHTVNVAAGVDVDITFDIDFATDFFRVPGFQLVPEGSVIGGRWCVGLPNSTGHAAEMVVSGNTSIQANDLQLGVRDLPPNQFGYFLMGGGANSPIMPPGSQGNLCIGNRLGRQNRAGEVLFSGANGAVIRSIDLTNVARPQGSAAIMSGSYWVWQFWYRDRNPQSTSNFSDAYLLIFSN